MANFTLRLITYNIRKGKGASGRSRTAFRGVSQALRDHGADLVLVQEAFHTRDDDHHQSNELADALGLHVYYEPNKRRRVGHHGNTTLSRHRATEVSNFDISTNPIERRGALYVKLDTPSGFLHVINVHLGLNQGQRRRQVRWLADIVERMVPRNEALVIAGDFNDWNERMDAVVRQRLEVRNAFGDLADAPRTWPAPRPVFKLDRVYMRNLKARGPELLRGEPWRELSDHLPLAVTLERSKSE